MSHQPQEFVLISISESVDKARQADTTTAIVPEKVSSSKARTTLDLCMSKFFDEALKFKILLKQCIYPALIFMIPYTLIGIPLADFFRDRMIFCLILSVFVVNIVYLIFVQLSKIYHNTMPLAIWNFIWFVFLYYMTFVWSLREQDLDLRLRLLWPYLFAVHINVTGLYYLAKHEIGETDMLACCLCFMAYLLTVCSGITFAVYFGSLENVKRISPTVMVWRPYWLASMFIICLWQLILPNRKSRLIPFCTVILVHLCSLKNYCAHGGINGQPPPDCGTIIHFIFWTVNSKTDLPNSGISNS